MMKEKLEQIKAEAVAKIQEADVPEKLNDVRVKFLGKKGELTAVLKGMKDVAPEDCCNSSILITISCDRNSTLCLSVNLNGKFFLNIFHGILIISWPCLMEHRIFMSKLTPQFLTDMWSKRCHQNNKCL